MALSKTGLFNSVLLFGSMLAFGLAVFIFNWVAARNLHAQLFGMLSLTISWVTFCANFFDFGLSFSGSRCLSRVVNDGRGCEARGLFGAISIIQLVYALIFSGVLIVIVQTVPAVHATLNGIPGISIVASAFFLQIYAPNIMKGISIPMLVGFYILQGMILLLVLIPDLARNPNTFAFLFFLAPPAAYLATLIVTRPKLRDFKRHFISLMQENSRYGFRVFSGSLISQICIYFTPIILGYYFVAKEVGFYTLSLTIANGISLFSLAIGTVHFRSFAKADKVSRPLVVQNILFLSLACGTYYLVCGPLICFLFGAEYEPVITISKIMVAGSFIKGCYQPFLSFLHSKGRRELSNVDFSYAAISALLTYGLAPKWGPSGAACAYTISMFYYFLASYFLYRKLYGIKTCVE